MTSLCGGVLWIDTVLQEGKFSVQDKPKRVNVPLPMGMGDAEVVTRGCQPQWLHMNRVTVLSRVRGSFHSRHPGVSASRVATVCRWDSPCSVSTTACDLRYL